MCLRWLGASLFAAAVLATAVAHETWMMPSHFVAKVGDDQAFPKAGLATIWLELKPREIELTDDQVAEYLDEIEAFEVLPPATR